MGCLSGHCQMSHSQLFEGDLMPSAGMCAGQAGVRKGLGFGAFLCGVRRELTPATAVEAHAMLGGAHVRLWHCLCWWVCVSEGSGVARLTHNLFCNCNQPAAGHAWVAWLWLFHWQSKG